MKTIYMTLFFFAILLAIFIFLYLVEIPSPGKTVEETYKLLIK